MPYSEEYKYPFQILKQAQVFRLVSPNPSHTCTKSWQITMYILQYVTPLSTTSLDLHVTVPSRDYV